MLNPNEFVKLCKVYQVSSSWNWKKLIKFYQVTKLSQASQALQILSKILQVCTMHALPSLEFAGGGPRE